MRFHVLLIVLLSCAFLGGRALWSAQTQADVAAGPERHPLQAADRSAVVPIVRRPQIVEPFPQPRPMAADPDVRLPAVAADLSHVRDFAFDGAVLRSVSEGDQIRVDFPPLGGRYDLHVDEVRDSPEGRTIRAHIDYDRRAYPTLITVSDGWSFGSLTTPEGHYEFTARGGRARMIDGAELERRAYVPNHTLIPNRS